MARSLLKEEILLVHSILVKEFGSHSLPSHLPIREEALNYLIDVVDSDMLGNPLYPEIHQKAGVYLFNILADQIFPMANQRTAFGICLLFLKMNHCRLHKSLNHMEFVHFIQAISADKHSLKEVQEWFKYMITPL